MKRLMVCVTLVSATVVSAWAGSKELGGDSKGIWERKNRTASEKGKVERAEQERISNESAKKQQESSARRMYETKPEEFFKAYIDKKVCLDPKGGVRVPEGIGGEILQIVSDDTFLLMKRDAENPVAIVGYDTSEYVDGKGLYLDVVAAGRFQYGAVAGFQKTILKYEAPKYLTLEDYNRLRTNGVDFCAFALANVEKLAE